MLDRLFQSDKKFYDDAADRLNQFWTLLYSQRLVRAMVVAAKEYYDPKPDAFTALSKLMSPPNGKYIMGCDPADPEAVICKWKLPEQP